MVRWVEISDRCERRRFTALSEAMSAAGIENEVEFIEVEDATSGKLTENFESVLAEAKTRFHQIRVGGSLREAALKVSDRLPSAVMSFGFADAFVNEGGEWWARNFATEGIQRALVDDIRVFDFSGGVFVLGATPAAKGAVAALSRIGFKRFSITDPNEEAGRAFIEELEKVYFLVQFQFVPRHMITQLPSMHSVGVNTLAPGEDEGTLGELVFFNFLKPGGVWLDLPLGESGSQLEILDHEALAVGAIVESGARIAALTDTAWVEACFGNKLDTRSYGAALAAPNGTSAEKSEE